MKVRIVCSATASDFKLEIHQSFIHEQVESLKKLDSSLQFEYFFIKKGGLSGYFSALKELGKKEKCDLIHAHGGLPAFLSILLMREPVVSTFHGSDINSGKTRFISAIAAALSKKSIYVSQKLRSKSLFKAKSYVIPCGVDLNLFKPLDMEECRKALNLDSSKKYILFSSAFSNPVKNYPLLKQAISLWPENPPEVIELKGISRNLVPLYMNAANVCVLTSFSEGSPQFIKEALACNRPLVSTPVGDIEDLIGNAHNCRITKFEPSKLCDILLHLINETDSNGRNNMNKYDLEEIALRIISVYKNK